ncbi:hypothetical protein FAF44_37625 [Nonomuraea sp. MG754425]|uniref:hypothetical protein n=1 Tax=Nonomuraea sp. MG754425 TaxID=2570319 RepID=UPI001F32116E|nr:hypothetical protein [Nonomuraea sp. MG754425]MCF6474064.1 hypothetical protein [Nonomuraea sp. MG754425]
MTDTSAYGKITLGKTTIPLESRMENGTRIEWCRIDRLQMADLIAWLSTATKSDAPLPDFLAEVTIDLLGVTVTTAKAGATEKRAFTFDAYLSHALPGIPATIRSLSVTHTPGTKLSATCALTVRVQPAEGEQLSMEFLGALDETAAGWTLSASWMLDPDSDPLTLTMLAGAFGIG